MILSHYTADFEFSSPFIIFTMQESTGVLKGKKQVEEYWTKALERVKDLKFELLDVFIGVSSITIFYKAIFGKLATEVMFFNTDNKVYKSIAHYNNCDI